MARRRFSWRAALVLIVIVAAGVVLLLAGDALARAGGGQHYSGGGHSGGGGGGGFHSSGSHSGGGSSSDGFFLWYLLELLFRYPAVGVPVLICVIAFFWYAGRKGTSAYQGSVIRRGNSLADNARRDANLAALSAEDPTFDVGAFLQRVGTAFHKIQAAWCAQDLAAVRPFISDGVHERFSIQFDEQKAFGYRDQMEGIQILGMEIARVDLDELFQTIAVRVRASAADYEVSLADGRRSGSRAAEQFVEIWSFLRRRGTKTKPSAAGLIEGNCPNCGGLIEMNQSAKCKYCGAALRSGEHDWVLVEITQECEWNPDDGTDGPEQSGIVALRQADSGFNLQQVEDTASVMFWRKNMADRLGKINPIRKMATEEFSLRYAELLRTRVSPDGQRTFYGRCGVGSVETIGAMTDAQKSRVLVEVRWSGTRCVVERDGRLVSTGQECIAGLLMVLTRKADATSNVAEAISSAHCPGCGAPESNTAASACEFCGHVLNDPSRWLLDEAIDSRSPQAAGWMAQLRGAGRYAAPATVLAPGAAAPAGDGARLSSLGLLGWMTRAVLADGQIEPRERAMLDGVARRRNVPPDRVESLIQAALRGELDSPQPENRAEATSWLEAMAAIVMADGRITPEEAGLLQQTAESCGLSKYDLDQLLKRVRAQLYAQAKQQLRAARRG